MQIIEITFAESLAKELAQFFPSHLRKYPGALVIAAAAPIERRLRAATPSPHSKWPDALAELARILPGSPDDSERELYRLAAEALGGMETVSQHCREFEAQKRADAAAAEVLRIKQEPADDAARKAMFAAAEERREKHRALWNPARFDAMEADAKKTILEFYGRADCPRDSSLLEIAFSTLSRLPHLRELAKIALG